MHHYLNDKNKVKRLQLKCELMRNFVMKKNYEKVDEEFEE